MKPYVDLQTTSILAFYVSGGRTAAMGVVKLRLKNFIV
jgi:hypothetical protein